MSRQSVTSGPVAQLVIALVFGAALIAINQPTWETGGGLAVLGVAIAVTSLLISRQTERPPWVYVMVASIGAVAYCLLAEGTGAAAIAAVLGLTVIAISWGVHRGSS